MSKANPSTMSERNRANELSWWARVSGALKHHRWQFVGLLLLLAGLGWWFSDRLFPFSADALWEWLDPVSGIMSLVLTFVVLYNQAYQRWEDGLEKRLDVDFVLKGQDKPIIQVKNAFLAGEADIRAWGQQLGRQIMGDMHLDLSWDRSVPVIKKDGAEVVKSYTLTIFLVDDPFARGEQRPTGKAEASKHTELPIADFIRRRSRLVHSTIHCNESGYPKLTWCRTAGALSYEGDCEKLMSAHSND